MKPDYGQDGPSRPSLLRRHSHALLTCLVTLLVLASVAFFVAGHFALIRPSEAAAPKVAKPDLVGDVATYQSKASSSLYVVSPQKSAQTDADAASTPAFNNIAISISSSPASADIDGSGYSYSQEALLSTNLEPGLSFLYDGISFVWPDVDHQDDADAADNWQASGQVLPLTQSSTQVIGFIGAATNGSVRSTVTVTYSDGSTQDFSLGLSDWTLNGGKSSPAYGNTIVSAQPYRDTQGGQQNKKTYLFYAKITTGTSKQAVSVTLPYITGASTMHIFAYGARSASYTNPYNSVGLSDAAYPSAGNFDGRGNSYAAPFSDWGAGYTLYYNENLAKNYNMGFKWPDVLPGSPDNYLADGQTIPLSSVAHAAKLGFIGAATGGPSYGTAYINYSDGTRTAFRLGFSDWTLNGYKQSLSFGNRYIYSASYYNSSTGKQNASVFLFYAETNLDPTKTVKSVTLPATTSQGHIHVYSMATGVTGFFDNVAITDDKAPLAGNMDGTGDSYSLEALQKAGIPFSTPGHVHPFTVNGASFTIQSGNGIAADNWIANGQTIPISNKVANATTLVFLGASGGGASSGSVTLQYSDGTTATEPLVFADWCTGGYHNYVAATMHYRNTPYGVQNRLNYLYYNEVPLAAGKTLVSVQLPAHTSGGTMHIFAVSERAGSYNNVAITDDAKTTVGGFDANNGNSYSEQALQKAGLVAGSTFSFDGYTFPWPDAKAGQPDNYLLSQQVLPLATPMTANALALLGAGTDGGSTGDGIITYADGRTQSFHLTFPDWCNDTYGRVAVTMNYHNTQNGQQQGKTYIYYLEVPLSYPGDPVQSITLPWEQSLHVFSYAFK